MKYAYIGIGLVVIACIGILYFVATNNSQQKNDDSYYEAVPEGFHRMGDGSLMKNPEPTLEQNDQSAEKITSDPNQKVITIDPNARVFKVRGVNYGYDVKEIQVKKGETVTIEFESTDGFHDWVVDEFDTRTEKVQPGKATSVTFVADTAGTFEYYCSVGKHRLHGMVGKLVVTE